MAFTMTIAQRMTVKVVCVCRLQSNSCPPRARAREKHATHTRPPAERRAWCWCGACPYAGAHTAAEGHSFYSARACVCAHRPHGHTHDARRTAVVWCLCALLVRLLLSSADAARVGGASHRIYSFSATLLYSTRCHDPPPAHDRQSSRTYSARHILYLPFPSETSTPPTICPPCLVLKMSESRPWRFTSQRGSVVTHDGRPCFDDTTLTAPN